MTGANIANRIRVLNMILTRRIISTATSLPILISTVHTVRQRRTRAQTLIRILTSRITLILISTVLHYSRPPRHPNTPILFTMDRTRAHIRQQRLQRYNTVTTILTPYMNRNYINLPIITRLMHNTRFTTRSPHISILHLQNHTRRPQHMIRRSMVTRLTSMDQNPNFGVFNFMLRTRVRLDNLFQFSQVRNVR